MSSRALFLMAKSHREIENQGFNGPQNRYGYEHICHHQRPQSAVDEYKPLTAGSLGSKLALGRL